MNRPSWIDPGLEAELTGAFNIIEQFETKQFDCGNMDFLISRLKATRKETFDTLDRYVIVHFDTDFYWHGHGINLNNLFSVWKSLDLPLYTMIYYTNHHGITEEINKLCCSSHVKDRPMVIETLINLINYQPRFYENFDANIDSIDRHGLCMLAGSQRSHRGATFNHLKHLQPSHLAMTIHKKNESVTS